MPTNLNALIRYKEIDKCLKNQYIQCTIETLIDKCSEALGEYRGVYKRVSERTIRDDIRVMRSDILGFNAPILFNDGFYIYEDKDYSIFNISIYDFGLLKEVLQMLIEERKNIKDSEVDKVILNLANLIGSELPDEVLSDIKEKTIKKKSEPKVSGGLEYIPRDRITLQEEEFRSPPEDREGESDWDYNLIVKSCSKPYDHSLPWANILKLFA